MVAALIGSGTREAVAHAALIEPAVDRHGRRALGTISTGGGISPPMSAM